MLKYAEELTAEDEVYLKRYKMNSIVVVNKTDLPQKIDINRVKELAGEHKDSDNITIAEEGIDAN